MISSVKHREEIRKFADRKQIVLVGSRGMAQRSPKKLPEDTDYDYAVDYLYQDELARAFEQGWKEAVDESYLDRNTSFVLEKVIDGVNVQVSSRCNLQTYLDALTKTKPDYYWKYLWKGSSDCLSLEERKAYWEKAYGYDFWNEDIPF